MERPRGGATDKQIAVLMNLGVRRETAMGYGRRQASAVIDDLKSKRCTLRQRNALLRLGYGDAAVADLNFHEANKILDAELGARSNKGVV